MIEGVPANAEPVTLYTPGRDVMHRGILRLFSDSGKGAVCAGLRVVMRHIFWS
ncbi:hypothetical protein K3X41_12450 [Aliiroseovarius crassostreae]|uniref:hypothetical protein n=1 Tax=Aliiroseovarius crassostreae TaxID=154981 RepID=UPI0022073A2D|nr:hypothetical protein [Aliiroseovarius crassostreae]UWQ10684.1 hypothetical protein K3X41_12450 [Aliiroseovarius crassostreae]